MKRICSCITKEITKEFVELSIDSNGLNISYDAYSTDSSFDTTIPINFCPFCGESIDTLLERRELYYAKLKKKGIDLSCSLELMILEEEEKQKKLSLKYNPNIYLFDGIHKISAFSPKAAKEIIKKDFQTELTNKQFKIRVKCIEQMSPKKNVTN